jgi:hypothetical protein
MWGKVGGRCKVARKREGGVKKGGKEKKGVGSIGKGG